MLKNDRLGPLGTFVVLFILLNGAIIFTGQCFAHMSGDLISSSQVSVGLYAIVANYLFWRRRQMLDGTTGQYYIHLALSEEARARLDKLIKDSGQDLITLIRRALSTYTWLVSATMDGGQLWLRHLGKDRVINLELPESAIPDFDWESGDATEDGGS